ncbi:hypothetical protein [uncultured Shewanella sp.]|uniref:hypothetical protein n=1 Tax=uncultured Shewanella sp. TaxID=173975 RepID=UPI00262066C1|nr:hypothetical protein [uncultured Shewanella sp.]
MLYSIIKWIFRAWPLLASLLIIYIHHLTLTLPCLIPLTCWSNEVINKYLSFSLNILGGILVLYSINSNLGVFKKGNLVVLFCNWLKSFPLIKRKQVSVTKDLSMSYSNELSARIDSTKPPETIDELYKYTQEQLFLLRKDLKNERKNQEAALNKITKECSNKHRAINKNVLEVNDKLKTVAIGGIKLQIFGFFLVSYGSYIAL